MAAPDALRVGVVSHEGAGYVLHDHGGDVLLSQPALDVEVKEFPEILGENALTEKAARGEDRRVYPWGDEPDPNKANYNETGIGITSAVGCFPAGASPYGCLDMAGNVDEWTRSLWGKDRASPTFKYPHRSEDGREDLKAGTDVRRVLRGGAFHFNVRDIRCALRYSLNPDFWNLYYGFRVVLAPFSSEL